MVAGIFILAALALLTVLPEPLLASSSAGWKNVGEREREILWDLEGSPLQIRTNSPLVIEGVGESEPDVMRVEFVPLEFKYKRHGIVVIFSDPPQYNIGRCTENIPFHNLPRTQNRIWTISKDSSMVNLTCNGVEIFNFQFDTDYVNRECFDRWRRDVHTIIFKNDEYDSMIDTASDTYRAKPAQADPCSAGDYMTEDGCVECGWQDVAPVRGTRLRFDMEGNSLQVKKFNRRGRIRVDLWTADQRTFVTTMMVQYSGGSAIVELCYDKKRYDLELPSVPSGNGPDVWKFTKNGKSYRVECNGELVHEEDFGQDEDCSSELAGRIEFHAGDDQSDQYLP